MVIFFLMGVIRNQRSKIHRSRSLRTLRAFSQEFFIYLGERFSRSASRILPVRASTSAIRAGWLLVFYSHRFIQPIKTRELDKYFTSITRFDGCYWSIFLRSSARRFLLEKQSDACSNRTQPFRLQQRATAAVRVLL